MVRAGTMRHRITIQERNAPVDGEVETGWSTFATRRAALDRAMGREVVGSAQRNARVPVVFRIRYLDGVLPAMRVLFAGKLHNIVSAVDEAGLKEELVITTELLVEETS